MKESLSCFQRRCRINLLDKLLSENLPFPFIDYLKDPIVILKRDGRILEVNTAFSELINVRKEKIRGLDYHNFEPLNALDGSITKCLAKNAEQSEQIPLHWQVFNASVIPVVINNELSRISIVLKDISLFVQTERELLKKNKELIVINTLSSAFISSANIDAVFDDLLEKALLVSDLSIGWLVLVENHEYILKSQSGLSLEFKNKLKTERLNYIYEKAIGSDAPMYVLEPAEITDELKREGIVFFLAIPLRVGKEVIGLLILANRVEVMFDFDMAYILSLIGNNFSLILEKIRLFQQAQRLAITDSLTGLYNARFFYSSLEGEIARAERYSMPFSLILFDIDNFKILNDTYGHQAGDDVLHSLAGILKDTARKSDIVARYGGEEFIIVLPNTSKNETLRLAQRIKEAVEGSNFLGDESIQVTLSGGIATFPEDAQDAKSLLYAADMAMYQAKAAGKKQIQTYRKKNETGV